MNGKFKFHPWRCFLRYISHQNMRIEYSALMNFNILQCPFNSTFTGTLGFCRLLAPAARALTRRPR